MRRLLVIVTMLGAMLAAGLAGAAPADAHAVLVSSAPGQGVTVPNLPKAVELRFSESVTTVPTSLRVYGPDGQRVDDGAVTHPGGAGSRIAVGLRGSGDDAEHGSYLVSWRVVSADSHPVSGAFTFNVRTSSAAPHVSATQTDPTVSVLLGATRWLGYVGLALLIGSVVFRLACRPGDWPLRAARLAPWGLGGALAAAVLGLLLKAPYDAGFGLGHLGRPALMREVLGSTYGHGVLGRVGLLLVGAVLLRWAAGSARIPRAWAPVAAAAGAGLVLSFAVTGHAVTGRLPVLSTVVDAAHVGAMAVWVGGLATLLVLLRRPATGGAAAIVPSLERFSGIATAAVAVLVATGGYQAWRQVGGWMAFPETTYGRELLAKLGLVALVLAVAWGSRTRVRAFATGRGAGDGVDLAGLRRSVLAESVVLVAVLVLTAALVATQPARTAYHPSASATLQVGPDVVIASAVPDGERRMEIHLLVRDAQRRPTEPAQVSASASLPDRDIGPLPLRLDRVGEAHWIAVLQVPVTGDWLLTVTVRTTAIDEYSRSMRLPIR